MHARLSLIATVGIAAAVLFSACSSHARPGSDRVASAEAHTLVANGATLLDVRTPGEFSSGHIDGALNISVDELEAHLAEVPRGKPVVVYCQSGARAATATTLLRANGYDARSLGGISAW